MSQPDEEKVCKSLEHVRQVNFVHFALSIVMIYVTLSSSCSENQKMQSNLKQLDVILRTLNEEQPDIKTAWPIYESNTEAWSRKTYARLQNIFDGKTIKYEGTDKNLLLATLRIRKPAETFTFEGVTIETLFANISKRDIEIDGLEQCFALTDQSDKQKIANLPNEIVVRNIITDWSALPDSSKAVMEGKADVHLTIEDKGKQISLKIPCTTSNTKTSIAQYMQKLKGTLLNDWEKVSRKTLAALIEDSSPRNGKVPDAVAGFDLWGLKLAGSHMATIVAIADVAILILSFYMACFVLHIHRTSGKLSAHISPWLGCSPSKIATISSFIALSVLPGIGYAASWKSFLDGGWLDSVGLGCLIALCGVTTAATGALLYKARASTYETLEKLVGKL